MVKKEIASARNQTVLTLKQNLLHASNALQRHIFNKNSQKIREFLDQNLKSHQVSFGTHDRYMDIIRQTQKAAKNRPESSSKVESQASDSEQERIKIRKQVSLQTEFEVMLEKSLNSYQRTYDLFKKASLLQKYGHLLGHQISQKQPLSQQNLTDQEKWALKKIKYLYRKYKVSSMFKQSISSKVRKHYIQQLVQKGFLQQRNQIVSLTS